jgi:predicted DsbA family dithiol-disulfide isomerase
MAEIQTTRLIAVGDLNCPFCYTLNEWLHEFGYGDSVDLWGVDHIPGLTREIAATREAQEMLRSEYDRVSEKLCDKVYMVLPGRRPSSTLALATLTRLASTETPERVAAARHRLYQALWHQGLDFSDPEVVSDVLHDYDLGDLDAMADENSIVAEKTATWKTLGIDLIPAVVAPTGAKYVGLGTKKALKVFLGSALFSSEREGGCKI